MDLIDIYRTFYPEAAEYTFFSIAHGTFSKIDHMLGHKTSLIKLKKTEIMPEVFLDHNGINYKKTKETTSTWRLNMLLNNYNYGVIEEINTQNCCISIH